MNLFIKILIIINLIFISKLFSQDCKAHLTINCNIENVNVYVDDILVSGNKQFQIDLQEGIHKIIVMENSNRWDAQNIIDSVIIKDCNDMTIQYQFARKVLLNTDPEDVYVFSNDSLIGYTPLLIPLELNNIRLEKPGFESVSINYSDFEKNKSVKLKYIGENSDSQFFDKVLFKILAGSMVLLGATTAYFKLKADNKFDEYKITHDKDLLDQTNTFDTISGITFAAFQINFGALIYFFLVD